MTKLCLTVVAAHNPGRIMRKLFGIGKPKSLHGGYADGELRALAQLLMRLAMGWRSAIETVPRFRPKFPALSPGPAAA